MTHETLGRFDGVYRYVIMYLVPDYLAQGWEITDVLPGGYSDRKSVV